MEVVINLCVNKLTHSLVRTCCSCRSNVTSSQISRVVVWQSGAGGGSPRRNPPASSRRTTLRQCGQLIANRTSSQRRPQCLRGDLSGTRWRGFWWLDAQSCLV
jgi:hypothetical protein